MPAREVLQSEAMTLEERSGKAKHYWSTTVGIILAVLSLMLLLGSCDEGPGTTEPPPAETPPPEQPPEPEPTEMDCVSHPASQILGDWDASGNVAQDDEVYTFLADGTYQRTYSSTAPAPGLDQPPVTDTVRITGTYSYVAETCLLIWEPRIANITHFVAWNGSDQFSTKFSPGGSVVITTFDRR